MFIQDIALIARDWASRKYLMRKYMLAPSVRIVFVILRLVAPLAPGSVYRLDRPIFVVGCSRSGTDIFVNLFGMHEDLANWSEAGQIFELDYYNPDIDHYKGASPVKDSDRRRIQMAFAIFLQLRRKKRFLNKHPQNSLRIEYLKALFPDACFIHVIRDGRAVVHSNYKKACSEGFRRFYPFGNFPKPVRWRDYLDLPPLEQYACQWRDIVQHVRSTGATVLSPNEYVEVTYEELCRDVHGSLRKIDVFLGLDPDRRRYEHIPQKLTSQNFRWNSELDDQQTKKIESLIGRQLQELGYRDSYESAKV